MKSQVVTASIIGLFIGIIATYFFMRMGQKSSQNPQNIVCAPMSKETTTTTLPIVYLENGLLPPPKFADDAPEIFESKHPGEVKISWKPVPGAVKYRVIITDKSGKEITGRSTTHNVMYMQKIPWNNSDQPFVMYRVRLAAINGAGDTGPTGETRQLKLYKDHAFFGTPEKVDPLVAPDIKSITTED